MARYATLIDFPRLGLFPAALVEITSAQKNQALDAAGDYADQYLASRFCLPLVWVFLPPTAITADDNGPTIDAQGEARFTLALDIYGATSDPTATFVVQGTDEAAPVELDWLDLADFAIANPITEDQHTTLEIIGAPRYLRIKYTCTGGSFSAQVTFNGDNLKRIVCDLAAFSLLTARGLDPAGRDEILVLRNEQARRDLRDIRSGKSDPFFIDQTPEVDERSVFSSSQPRRGW